MANKKKPSNAALVRVHKTSKYTVMSNRHLFDKPPLSLKAKGLMSMFLALPDNWNYSINGIVAICKESRDAVKSTINELKQAGYLHIEKIMPGKSKSNKIEYVYHIFEEKKRDIAPETEKGQEGENPPLEIKKQEVENQALEKQALENQALENPIQINTKEINTNEGNTNNKTRENVNIFCPLELFNLYKGICKSYPQPRELTGKRVKKCTKRIEEHPAREFWQTVCENAENSSFCRKSKWFNFDWIIKNDNNAVKVFEGNYDDNRFKTANQNVINIESGKYAKYHAEQNAAGGAHA